MARSVEQKLARPVLRARAGAREPKREREFPHHIAVINALRMFARHDVVFMHPANGEKRDARTAAKLKAMGVSPGAPDIWLIIAGKTYLLEMKKPGGAKPTKDQREFMTRAVEAGAETAVAYGVDPAIDVLNRWGAFRVRVHSNMIARAA